MARVTVRTLNYTPSFKGRHNEVRSKSWLVLYNRHLATESRGLTARELAEHAGVSLPTLYVLLGRWCRWRYVLRDDNTEKITWKIASRGRKWLDRWSDTMPLARYLQEIEAHQALNPPILHKLKKLERPRLGCVKSSAVAGDVRLYAVVGDGTGHHRGKGVTYER